MIDVEFELNFEIYELKERIKKLKKSNGSLKRISLYDAAKNGDYRNKLVHCREEFTKIREMVGSDDFDDSTVSISEAWEKCNENISDLYDFLLEKDEVK